MRARIRYGNEADILSAVAQTSVRTRELDFASLRHVSSTVLAFSASVGHIPDMPNFDTVVGNLGIQIRQLPSLEGCDPTTPINDKLRGLFAAAALQFVPPPIKTIEVTNPEVVDISKLKALASGLFRLAYESNIDNEGILFIDHSVIPTGDIIAVDL